MPMTPIGWVPDQLLGGIGAGAVFNPNDYYGANPEDLAALMGEGSGNYSSYDPITLPQQFWPTQEQYDRMADQMRSLGIEPPPLGTLDPKTTAALGQALYEQPGFLDNPAAIAAIVMGGAALGGAFAGGGAGFGGAAPAAGGASGGLSPITVGASPLAGGVPAVTGAATSAWGGAIPALTSMPAVGGLGTAASGLGLSPITVGATPLAGGIPSIQGITPGIMAGGSIPSLSSMPALGGSGGGGMFEGLLGGQSNWPALIGGLLGAIDARNQPDSITTNQGGTSTSTYGNTLPAEITGPAGEALAALRGLFTGGYTVAGIDPASTAAISGLEGFAGGGGINPYLDTVFNAAANSTQNRLASEFARSGRNISASLPARSEELQHLAAGIYGPGFEAERSRQYGSLLPLLGAGDYRRGIEQQQFDAPTANLMRYLSGLQGLMPFFPGTQTQNTMQTGSVTQPLFSNPWAGFLGGAQLGSLFSGG